MVERMIGESVAEKRRCAARLAGARNLEARLPIAVSLKMRAGAAQEVASGMLAALAENPGSARSRPCADREEWRAIKATSEDPGAAMLAWLAVEALGSLDMHGVSPVSAEDRARIEARGRAVARQRRQGRRLGRGSRGSKRVQFAGARRVRSITVLGGTDTLKRRVFSTTTVRGAPLRRFHGRDAAPLRNGTGRRRHELLHLRPNVLGRQLHQPGHDMDLLLDVVRQPLGGEHRLLEGRRLVADAERAHFAGRGLGRHGLSPSDEARSIRLHTDIVHCNIYKGATRLADETLKIAFIYASERQICAAISSHSV